MASIRERKRADGTVAYNVVYMLAGKQTSVTFNNGQAADDFLQSITLLGAERAMAAFGIAPTPHAAQRLTGLTLADCVRRYIDSRSGVALSTIHDYNTYLRRDITPIGHIPLELLTRDDISGWIQSLTGAGKTIANKHGLVSAALNSAVRAGLIPANPAEGVRIPRTERREMVFVTRDEFPLLLAGFTAHWRPMVEFLVLSGARFGEVSALRPSDVDRDAGTVRISRARKRTYEPGAMYQVGPTKTARSERTINVATKLLDKLDYGNNWLFVNTKGGAVQLAGFRSNVWYKSVGRAVAGGLGKRPRIHDMRHTCASWMIAKGVPLPVIQQHLGHNSIATTVNLYGHLDRSQAAAAADLIGADLYGDEDGDRD